MIEIPPDRLNPETLSNVIESFVLREGTDYGAQEVPLEDKVARVFAQLKRGEVRLVYDAGEDSCTIVTLREFKRLCRAM